MDALLKKYAGRIDSICYTHANAEDRMVQIEKLLLQFLLEYTELKENKKEK